MKIQTLYIETLIKGDLAAVWKHTQTPEIHQQWDLRFTDIEYLPKNKKDDLQRFDYQTQIGFGLKVSGKGESVAHKIKENGEALSVLKFWSDNPISIIKQGGGYWKYIPQKEGVQFLTQYNYQTRWGHLGFLFDQLIFRPIMRRTTALSFDILKKWIETKVPPQTSIKAYLSCLIGNTALALIWIYQGVVPKLLFPHTGEISMMEKTGVFPGWEPQIVTMAGIAEILLGISFLYLRKKWPHQLSILALVILSIGASITDTSILIAPFNVFIVGVSMIAISVMVLLQLKDMPKVSNSLLKPKK